MQILVVYSLYPEVNLRTFTSKLVFAGLLPCALFLLDGCKAVSEGASTGTPVSSGALLRVPYTLFPPRNDEEVNLLPDDLVATINRIAGRDIVSEVTSAITVIHPASPTMVIHFGNGYSLTVKDEAYCKRPKAVPDSFSIEYRGKTDSSSDNEVALFQVDYKVDPFNWTLAFADYNQDCIIDLEHDFLIFRLNFMGYQSEQNSLCRVTDTNGDGQTNGDDFFIFRVALSEYQDYVKEHPDLYSTHTCVQGVLIPNSQL